MVDFDPTRLFKFIGYGNPAASIWFIGAEEGLGGAMSEEEAQKNLGPEQNSTPLWT